MDRPLDFGFLRVLGSGVGLLGFSPELAGTACSEGAALEGLFFSSWRNLHSLPLLHFPFLQNMQVALIFFAGVIPALGALPGDLPGERDLVLWRYLHLSPLVHLPF